MDSENLDPNVVGERGRVKNLIEVFENMKMPAETQRGVSTPRTLAFPLNGRRFVNKGKAGANPDVNGGGEQENCHNYGEKSAMAMAVADQRPLAERRPNTNIVVSFFASSSSSSSSGGADFDSEQSNHNTSDDHSDDNQSFPSTERSECSFGGTRRCKKDFNSERSQSPLWNWKWKKEVRATLAQPFRLKTEQRGQIKEQQFMKKIQEMINEEEKHRIPLAQGLPWTTDEPPVLPKRHVKEQTKPLNVKLRTTTRAMERAEFDHLMEQKFNFLEEQKLQKERRLKLIQEEEIKRLRKEMIPHAQLMPFFDRPFIPKKCTKSPTIPKEPKFHNVHNSKCLFQYGLPA